MVLGRTIYVFIKLLPSILALRKDRVLWISDDKKDVDEERFKRHAKRILNTCLSLGPVYIKWGQWLSSRADILPEPYLNCLLYTSDAADEEDSVDLGGRRIIKKNSPYRKQQAVIGGLAASLAAGYASYRLTKKLKE